MKIIFDSEEEQDIFFEGVGKCQICPRDVGLDDTCEAESVCEQCWRVSIPHEIKQPEA